MFNNVKQSATLLSTDKHDNSKSKNGGTKSEDMIELKKKNPKTLTIILMWDCAGAQAD